MPFPIIPALIIRAAVGYAIKTGARIVSSAAAKRAAAAAAAAGAKKASKKLSPDPKKDKPCKTCDEKKSAPPKKPDHQAGKSQKKYGHARSEHGSQRPAQQLKDRARSSGNNQGHFSDNRLIEEAFSKAPTTKGAHPVAVSSPSNVYTPSGQTLTTKDVIVAIGAKGPKTAYPFIP